MKTVRGNVWDFPHTVCIPTNVGWKTNGENVMGRGLAAQAAAIFPRLPEYYGKFCRLHSERPYPLAVFEKDDRQFVCCPTKPLAYPPHLSWKSASDINVITETVGQLPALADELNGPILVVRFGCGNGGLRWDAVRPIMESLDDRFILVEPE